MTEVQTTRTNRIQISEEVDEIYNQLTEDSNKEHAPFATKKDVFVFAACMGSRSGMRTELPEGKKITIRREVLKPDDVSILKAIALAGTKDISMLDRFEDILTITEEYAHAGIFELKSYLLDQGGRPLWNLVDLITGSTSPGK